MVHGRFHQIPILFNPRLREGGDCFGRSKTSSVFNFQSTPPRRRRLYEWWKNKIFTFSIHASAKEATLQWSKADLQNFFQSTPPRRRRHLSTFYVPLHNSFSIHASAKEATPNDIVYLVFCANFQSTPPRRRRQQ